MTKKSFKSTLLFSVIATMGFMLSSCGEDGDTPTPTQPEHEQESDEDKGQPIGGPAPKPTIQFASRYSYGIPPGWSEKEMMILPVVGWMDLSKASQYFLDTYYGFEISNILKGDSNSPENEYTYVPVDDTGDVFIQWRPEMIEAVPIKINPDTWVCPDMDLTIHRQIRDGYVYLTISVPETKKTVVRAQYYELSIEVPYKHCDDKMCSFCMGNGKRDLYIWKISPGEWESLSESERDNFITCPVSPTWFVR